jgi:hypothetical protein
VNAQEIFDKVARHLLKQNAQAKTSDGYGCMYRTVDGLACAVGCLLTDEEARAADTAKDKDGHELNTGIANIAAAGMLPQRLSPFLGLLEHLQRVHDYKEPQQWREALRQVAHNAELSAAVLDEVSP